MESSGGSSDDEAGGFTTPVKAARLGDAADPESAMRGRIRDIFADPTLTPSQKFERVNALRGLAPATPVAVVPSPPPQQATCPHYQASCLMQCNVCSAFVPCRLCHPEMDRFRVAKLRCLACDAVVDPAATCSSCHARFATHACTKCSLYDSTPDKQIFHCDECGICRIGTRDTTHHCNRCNMCIVINTEEGMRHKCFENSFKQDCAACLNRLFDSREDISMLKCGHAMHKKCFKALLQSDYRCPTCKKAVVEMDTQWDSFEEEMEAQLAELKGKIPQDVLDRVMNVLCNECNIKFDSKFNPFHVYKCPECKGFNTNPV